jgi:hypothetical protein
VDGSVEVDERRSKSRDSTMWSFHNSRRRVGKFDSQPAFRGVCGSVRSGQGDCVVEDGVVGRSVRIVGIDPDPHLSERVPPSWSLNTIPMR